MADAADPSSAPADGPPPGIDGPRVTEWFAANIEGVTPPLSFAQIAGGRSNPTFRVEDSAGRAFALRRPPLSHVLPTAHDMSREHRLISALGPAGIPVPRAYGLCTDEAVNGRPFYVMEFVDGHILRTRPAAEAEFDEATRARIGPAMAATLAALHAVDVDAVGLGDLARRDGYVERQLKRWSQQYAQMKVEGVDHGGLVEKVAADLAASIPPQRSVSVVHGDYRLDNMVLADDGSVRAILDWEICTLGDPLADVGLLMVYWTDPDDELPVLGVAPTLASGFSRRAEVLEEYARASGRDVSAVPYFMAFGYWKLACILQGVYARYVAGAGAGDAGSVDEYPLMVRRLAEMAASSLGEQ
jgi:aminoglycoside phosphotransferase (APT) family kinase protein